MEGKGQPDRTTIRRGEVFLAGQSRAILSR
jgi:hypothetical protein